jgi:transcriptional regulator with XRE-family HTH domain
MPFGEKVRKLRKEKNWSQDELGAKVGIHGRHIGKYELGKVSPTAEAIIKLAKMLNVSTDYLLLENSDTISSIAIKDRKLLRAFEAVEKMNEDDKKVINSLIEAFVKKHQIEELLEK